MNVEGSNAVLGDMKLAIDTSDKVKLVEWLMKSKTTSAPPVVPLWGEEIRRWIAEMRKLEPLTLNSDTLTAKVSLGGLPYEMEQDGRKVQLFPVVFKTQIDFGLFQALSFALTGDDSPVAVADFIIGAYYYLAVSGRLDQLKDLGLHGGCNRRMHQRVEVDWVKEEGLPSTSIIMANLLGKEIVLLNPLGGSNHEIYRPSTGGASGSQIYLLKAGDNTILPLLELSPIVFTPGSTAAIPAMAPKEDEENPTIMSGLEEAAVVHLGMLVDVFCDADLSSNYKMKKIILAKLRTTLNAAKDAIAEANSHYQGGIYFHPTSQVMDLEKTKILGENSVLVVETGEGVHSLLNLASCYSQCVAGNLSFQSEIFLNVAAIKLQNVWIMIPGSVQEEDLPFKESLENLIIMSCLFERGIRVYYWNTEEVAQSKVFFPHLLTLRENPPPKPITVMFENGMFSPVMPLHPFEEAACARVPDVVCLCHMAEAKNEVVNVTNVRNELARNIVQEPNLPAPSGSTGSSAVCTSALLKQILQNPGVVVLKRIDQSQSRPSVRCAPVSRRTISGTDGSRGHPECPLTNVSTSGGRPQTRELKRLALSDSAGNYWRRPGQRRCGTQ